MMGRRNPDGWHYFLRTDRTAKAHAIRVYRRSAPAGQPKYRDFYFSTKGEALAKAKGLRDRYGNWRQSMPLEAFLRNWLETKTDLAPGTQKKYAGHINQDLAPFPIALVPVEDLTTPMVNTWLRSLKGRRRRTGEGRVLDETISPTTQRGALYLLRNALRDGKIGGLLAGENPATAVRGPHIETFRPPRLMDSELRRLFTALLDDDDAPLWWTLAVLGRRVGEVLGVQIPDFNRIDRVIEMNCSLNQGNRAYRTSRGKPHEPRGFVPPYVAQLLELQLERREAMRLAMGDRWIDTPFLFTTSVGTPRDPSAVDRRFQRVRRAANLPYLRLHDLRGYCATLALEETADLRMVQQYIGWASLDMAAHYVRVRMQRLAELGTSVEQRTRAFVDDDRQPSGVSSGVGHLLDTPETDGTKPDLNGRGAETSAAIEPGTGGSTIPGSFVPVVASDLVGSYRVPGPIPEVSSDTTPCPMMGCQARCQAALPPPYQRTKILLSTQTHPILGPALRAVERAEPSPLVRKQVRVGIARYLWWCAAHQLDPTFADERHLGFAFEAGSDSVSYRRQLRSYARRFVQEIIEQARPRHARDGSAIGVRHRPSRSTAKDHGRTIVGARSSG
jgi:integrase